MHIEDKSIEVFRLEEGVVFVGGEIAYHTPLFEYQFFDAELFSHAAKGDGFYQFLSGLRDRSETVDKTFAVAVEFLL